MYGARAASTLGSSCFPLVKRNEGYPTGASRVCKPWGWLKPPWRALPLESVELNLVSDLAEPLLYVN
jgi:hypothetical protein